MTINKQALPKARHKSFNGFRLPAINQNRSRADDRGKFQVKGCHDPLFWIIFSPSYVAGKHMSTDWRFALTWSGRALTLQPSQGRPHGAWTQTPIGSKFAFVGRL